jgi:Transglutaminase-like superfamily
MSSTTTNGKFQAWRALSAADRRFLVKAWLALPLADLALRVLPFPRVQRLAAGKGAPNTSGGEPAVEDLSRYARLTAVAAYYHVLPMTCLRQALALQYLLGRQGIETDLQLGVRKVGDELAAHAWLTHDGEPLGEPGTVSDQYVSLLPRRRR